MDTGLCMTRGDKRHASLQPAQASSCRHCPDAASVWASPCQRSCSRSPPLHDNRHRLSRSRCKPRAHKRLLRPTLFDRPPRQSHVLRRPQQRHPPPRTQRAAPGHRRERPTTRRQSSPWPSACRPRQAGRGGPPRAAPAAPCSPPWSPDPGGGEGGGGRGVRQKAHPCPGWNPPADMTGVHTHKRSS
jgi:hypothetical protein